MIRRVHIRVSGTDTEMFLFPEQNVPEEVTVCSTLQLPEIVSKNYRTYEDLVIVWNDDEQIPGLIDVVEFESNLKTLIAPLEESEETFEEEFTEENSETTSNSFEETEPSEAELTQKETASYKEKEPEDPTKSGKSIVPDRIGNIKILNNRHKIGRYGVRRVARTVCAETNVNHTFMIEKTDFSDRTLPRDVIIRKVSPTHFNVNGGLPEPIFSGKRGISVHRKYLPGAKTPYQISLNELGKIEAFRPYKSRLK